MNGAPPKSADKFHRQRTSSFVPVLLVVAALSLPIVSAGLEPVNAMRFSLAASLVGIWTTLKAPRIGMGSGPALLVFYWAFHFGLVLFWSLGQVPTLVNASDSSWATPNNLAEAIVPSAAFMLWVAAAYCLFVSIPAERVDGAARPVDEDRQVVATERMGLVGPLVLLAGLLVWGVVWVSSGVGIAGQYVAFLKATQGSLTPYAYLLIALGAGLMGGARSIRGLGRFAVVAYCLWMVPAFLLGLRGEVIIPLIAFAIGRTRSGRLRVTKWRLLLAGTVALSAGSFVRGARVGVREGLGGLNPLNGLAEMGYSIRPMIAVQEVQNAPGHTIVGIDTYLAPMDRLVMGRILGQSVTDTTADPSVFGTFIATNFGPIGGSISAEAFRAGGFLGVAVIAALIGALMARMDSTPSTLRADAAVACVSAILLLWVRNDFTPVLLSLTITLVVLVIVTIESRSNARIAGRAQVRRITRKRDRETGRR